MFSPIATRSMHQWSQSRMHSMQLGGQSCIAGISGCIVNYVYAMFVILQFASVDFVQLSVTVCTHRYGGWQAMRISPSKEFFSFSAWTRCVISGLSFPGFLHHRRYSILWNLSGIGDATRVWQSRSPFDFQRVG